MTGGHRDEGRDPASRPAPPNRVAVVVPAKDEQDRIGPTVEAAGDLPGVDVVVVVDDGSRDATATVAARAGADVVRHPRNRGKGAAMTTGARRVQVLDLEQDRPRSALLFLDADLGRTAAATAALTGPVLRGSADLTVAVLGRQRTDGGGHGFVVGLSRRGIVRATGWTPTQPLSGMRCLTPQAFDAALPLARGWGVETAMTIDLLTAGYRIEEVPCELQHRVTGSDWAGQLHRAAQYRDVALALAVRGARGRLARLRGDRPAR